MNIPDSRKWLSLEDFLKITFDAIIAVDQDQKIVLVNDFAELIFGFASNEFIGQPFEFFLPPKSAKILRKEIQQLPVEDPLARKMAERIVITAKRKNGSEFLVEVSVARLVRDHSVLFIISLRDVTLRQLIEQERERWVYAFENTNWGVAIGQAETAALETVNPAFARMYGYSVEEFTGKPIQDLYAPEERAKVPELLRSAHEKGRITFEARHLRKDGSTFPAVVDIAAVEDADGKELYRVVNVQDVSAQKAAEEALFDSESRAASIVESLEEGILFQDRSGAILTCNAAAEKILGLTAGQMTGMTSVNPLWNAIHEDGSPFPGEDHPAMVTLHTGKPCSNVVMGINKPDGTRTWISINSQPLFHQDNPLPSGVVATFTDITDRLEAYRLLEQGVQARTGELAALLDVFRDVASTLEAQPLLVLILERLKKVIDYTNAGIITIDKDYFTVVEFQGKIPREKILNTRYPAGPDTGYQRVMLTRKPVNIGDVWGADTWLKGLQVEAGPVVSSFYREIHSWLGVPLIVRDQLVGILRLDHTSPNYFTDERVRLVIAFADIAALAMENARIYQASQELIALQERQKLGRELHDSVLQALYGIALGVRTARTMLARDPAKAGEPLEYCLTLTETGMAEMRALIFELRPESLELEGVVAALTKQAAALRMRYSIRVDEKYGPEPQVHLQIKEALYRIGYEALQNIVKHANADRVEIQLDTNDQWVTLEIRDNGEGFEVRDSYPGHIGMKSMHERAEQAGGTFQVESSPGQGTTVRVQLPVV